MKRCHRVFHYQFQPPLCWWGMSTHHCQNKLGQERNLFFPVMICSWIWKYSQYKFDSSSVEHFRFEVLTRHGNKGSIRQRMSHDDPTWWQAKHEGQANPPVSALILSKQFQERCDTLPNYSWYQFNIIGLKDLTINRDCPGTSPFWSERGPRVTQHVCWSAGVEDRTQGCILGTVSWEFHKHLNQTQNLFFKNKFYFFVSSLKSFLFFHHTQLMK